MELEELEERLPLFLRTMTDDPFAKLLHIERGTGHAGFSYLFEALVVRDLRVFADVVDGTVQHYRDSDDLEIDAVVTAGDGRWAAFEVKLGQADIDTAAAHLLAFARKVDTTKIGEPATLAVVTASGYGYTRPDGVVVIPAATLGP